MAPSRGRGKARGGSAPSTSARPTRPRGKAKNAAPDIYQEMLAEDSRRTSETDDTVERPLKRRRVTKAGGSPARSTESPGSTQGTFSEAPSPPRGSKGKGRAQHVQTIEASSDADSEDESDFGFEDVDLNQPVTDGPHSANEDDDGIADVSISVDPATSRKPLPQARRKPATSAEKALRLLAHKAHVLCLLGHCMYVNTWCNNIDVQQHVHPLLSKKTKTYLRGKDGDSQFQRDRAFREGLEQASDVFRGNFKVNASGMRRAMGSADGQDSEANADVEPTSRLDLVKAAKEMEGSQDTGNQLFCALLRSAGVEARLVCSLQTLPLTNAQSKPSTPQKAAKTVIRALPPRANPATSDSNTDDAAVKGSNTIGKVPSARRRLGQPSFTPEPAAPAPVAPKKTKPVRKLDYPIFWVEAFNEAHQKWMPIDPLVTKTVGKPSKFEPPSSYALNQMAYVIAFEEDGVARDVTRRYTKAYNAKTRRQRVEPAEGGTQWFKKALRLFRRRGGMLDRDQTEDAELNQKEVREGLPNNVQDFKDHPVYALERHLKRHEIIEPKREAGKVNAGTAAKPRMEPVYRRSDVLVCRSADKWYRLGRIIQEGQSPLKHVPARRAPGRRSPSPDAEADETTGIGMAALYAYFQTQAYIAPPVTNGKIPRNAFGNLDIYVPSMVPPGGTHIRHALAQQAARILRVDYADAVTGFQFKGRHGTAIVQGAVVPTEYANAVGAVIDGILHEKLEEESLARSSVALRMWKRFLTGLRIKERVSAYGTDGEAEDVREKIDREVEEQEEIAGAGGFFAEEPAMPTAGKFSLVEMARVGKKTPAAKQGKKRKEESESEEEAESSGAETGGDEARPPARRSKRVRRTVVEDEGENQGPLASRFSQIGDDADGDGVAGGGFLPEDMDEDPGGGGFIPEADEENDRQNEDAEGFVPVQGEHDDMHSGGGFLPEATSEDEELDGRSGLLPDDHDDNDQSGGFIPDEGVATAPTKDEERADPTTEARPLSDSQLMQAEAERSASKQAETSHADDLDDLVRQRQDNTVPVTDANDSLSMHGALQDHPSEQGTERGQAQESGPGTNGTGDERGLEVTAEAAEAEDDRSDHGSMLSHDPEDEDAEPDWLESD